MEHGSRRKLTPVLMTAGRGSQVIYVRVGYNGMGFVIDRVNATVRDAMYMRRITTWSKAGKLYNTDLLLTGGHYR